MPNYVPAFPYKKAQLIFSSDRVVLHSREDAVLVFGKAAIALSSLGRVNIDSKEGTTINAPEVELGINAKEIGEPIAKASTAVRLLTMLIKDITKLSSALSSISETGLEKSVVVIASSAEKLRLTCIRVSSQLNEIKSEITYTR